MRERLAIVANFQALERFQNMNSSNNGNAWSRGRQSALEAKLSTELGDKYKILQSYQLISFQPLDEATILSVLSMP
jgi:hypothetical protein